MTRNGVNPRLTIEVLAQDCLDVRELYKAARRRVGYISLARDPMARRPKDESGAIPGSD
jgi:hypothetical protein